MYTVAHKKGLCCTVWLCLFVCLFPEITIGFRKITRQSLFKFDIVFQITNGGALLLGT